MKWQKGTPAKTGMYYVKLKSIDRMSLAQPGLKYIEEICTMPFYEKAGWLGDPEYSQAISERVLGWCPAEYIREDL